MSDTFRFKAGEKVKAGTQEAEVLAVLPNHKPPSYRVKILSSEREMVLDARLVKEADSTDA